MSDSLSLKEKAEIAASLLLLAPPSESQEVLKDVKIIAGTNPDIEKNIAKALMAYAKEQTVQVSLPGSTHKSLITEHGEISPGRFLCPRSHNSFTLDPYTLSVDDVKPAKPNDGNAGSVELEPFRKAIEDSLTIYLEQNFPKGAVSVFAPAKKPRIIIAYIETTFQKAYATGRWKSSWTLTVPSKPKSEDWSVAGEIKIQTHIYEEGNVQLFSAKKFEFTCPGKNPENFGRDLASKIAESDSDYQTIIGNSLDSMSSTIFKALRRQLPMMRSKLDWNKIASYQVGSEIARHNN